MRRQKPPHRLVPARKFQAMEPFVVARNPEPDSRLPYLVRLPLDGSGFRATTNGSIAWDFRAATVAAAVSVSEPTNSPGRNRQAARFSDARVGAQSSSRKGSRASPMLAEKGGQRPPAKLVIGTP